MMSLSETYPNVPPISIPQNVIRSPTSESQVILRTINIGEDEMQRCWLEHINAAYIVAWRARPISFMAGYWPTLVPRATLRGVAELHVASGMPQWRMFVTCCYF